MMHDVPGDKFPLGFGCVRDDENVTAKVVLMKNPRTMVLRKTKEMPDVIEPEARMLRYVVSWRIKKKRKRKKLT